MLGLGQDPEVGEWDIIAGPELRNVSHKYQECCRGLHRKTFRGGSHNPAVGLTVWGGGGEEGEGAVSTLPPSGIRG